MKAEIKTPVVVVAVVALLAVIVYFGMKTIGDVGSLDHGQMKYTPGVPPWKETDPSKRGPGGSPGVASPTAPAGMGAPALGNGSK